MSFNGATGGIDTSIFLINFQKNKRHARPKNIQTTPPAGLPHPKKVQAIPKLPPVRPKKIQTTPSLGLATPTAGLTDPKEVQTTPCLGLVRAKEGLAEANLPPLLCYM